MRYLRTDIPGFDELLEKGIPKGNQIIIEGGPGSGKTLLCLNMMNNFCLKGFKCLYMSFEESEKRLREHMHDFGWNVEKFESNGLLRIKRYNDLDIARSVEAMLSEAKGELLIDIDPTLLPQDFKPQILFMDSLTAISSAFSGEESRFRVYIERFFRYLEARNITSFLIWELPNPLYTQAISKGREAVEFLCDGIIRLYNILREEGTRISAIEIFKMRGTSFKKAIVEMEISKEGIIVYPHRIVPKVALTL